MTKSLVKPLIHSLNDFPLEDITSQIMSWEIILEGRQKEDYSKRKLNLVHFFGVYWH